MLQLLLLVIALCAAGAGAFRPAAASAARLSTRLTVFPWQKEKGPTESVAALKEELYSACRGTKNGIKATAEQRVAIADVIRKLEKANKEKKMTTSPTLDGSWELLFTTNTGSSAGLVGPFVGAVEQVISFESASYLNYVRLPGFSAYLRANWDTLSATAWRVNFETISLEILGTRLFTKPLVASGIWRKTFVDPDLRILYAQGQAISKGPVVENVYVLRRAR